MLNLKKKSVLFFTLFLLSATSFAGGKSTTVAKDVPSFNQAAAEACLGSAIGAECTIMFAGGSVTIGACVQVPDVNGNYYLSCQIDPSKIPSCKNKATSTPASALLFAIFSFGIYVWKRRQIA